MKNRYPTAISVLVCSALLTSHSALAQFSQQGPKLVGKGGDVNQQQGTSVALSADGNAAIVGGSSLSSFGFGFGTLGGPGGAWVWTRNGGVWTQQSPKLVGSGAIGNAHQGTSVSLSADGNTAIVGGLGDNSDAGAAWIWTRAAGAWTQQGTKLFGSGAIGHAGQGQSASLSGDGNTAIVGGPGDGSVSGAVWVWTRTGGVWTQQGTKLIGSGSVGATQQGSSVALSSDGNTAIVGGWGDNLGTGAAWVWTRSAGVWTQQGTKLVGSGSPPFAAQGVSVAISADGNTAIVGGYGGVWVWIRSGGIWIQQGNRLIVSGASVSLSADGNTAIFGGPTDSGDTGASWIWTSSGGVWTQQGTKLVGAGAVGSAQQGYCVAISGDSKTAIAGGPGDNGFAGAAWVFIFDPNSIPTASVWILMTLGVALALVGATRVRS